MNPQRTHCKNCGVPLDPNRPRRGAMCRSCERIAERKRDKERYHAKRARGDVTVLLAADFTVRRLADQAIAAGRVDRRCQTCYRRYHLETMETPCPNCASHLIDNPLEVSHAAA